MRKRKSEKLNCSMVFVLFVFTICLFLAPMATASQHKPIEIKFGHIAPPMAHGAKFGMEPWARSIEKATNGKVKFTIYPAQSLFKARDAIQAIETGLADMGHFPIILFTGRFNLITVMDLPFLITTPTSVNATKIIYALWNEFPEMKKDFSNMKVMMLQPADPYIFATKDKPIRNMKDLKGLKLRVLGKYPSMVMKSMGVSPLMIPMPELYEAASKGVIDGAAAFDTQILDLKLYEVWNYWTDQAIYNGMAIIAMNLEKWNSLPPDVRKTMEDMSYEGALLHAEEAFDATDEKLKKAAEKSGKKWERVELDKGEFEMWKEKMGKPIWDRWVQDMEKKGLPGRKVLDRALELVNKYQ